jgi:hypothetical protein
MWRYLENLNRVKPLIYIPTALAGIFSWFSSALSGDLYSLPNIKMIKSIRMRWVVHVEHMGGLRNAYNILEGKLEKEKHFGDVTVYSHMVKCCFVS